jgi:hypothetical protein
MPSGGVRLLSYRLSTFRELLYCGDKGLLALTQARYAYRPSLLVLKVYSPNLIKAIGKEGIFASYEKEKRIHNIGHFTN